jgi:uncharacterized membrane protein SpoIIM required for sporulation
MNPNDFIRLREKDWQRLQFLLDRHRGRSRMNADEVRELGTLYRAVTSDLALARRDYANQKVAVFLNQLLTRAHSYIYQQETTDLKKVLRYFTHTLPLTFRQTWIFTFAAFLMFTIPAIAGFRLAYVNPEVATPLGLGEQREILASHDTWTDIPTNSRPFISAFIMSNNIRVAILAFGGGVSFGLFSVYVLAANGLQLGAVLGLAAHYDMGQALLGFVLAHGVIELSVIFIASGAGLQLGSLYATRRTWTRRAPCRAPGYGGTAPADHRGADRRIYLAAKYGVSHPRRDRSAHRTDPVHLFTVCRSPATKIPEE